MFIDSPAKASACIVETVTIYTPPYVPGSGAGNAWMQRLYHEQGWLDQEAPVVHGGRFQPPLDARCRVADQDNRCARTPSMPCPSWSRPIYRSSGRRVSHAFRPRASISSLNLHAVLPGLRADDDHVPRLLWPAPEHVARPIPVDESGNHGCLAFKFHDSLLILVPPQLYRITTWFAKGVFYR
jgi:hypothetical protein